MIKKIFIIPFLQKTSEFKAKIKTKNMIKRLKSHYPDYKLYSFNNSDYYSIFKEGKQTLIVIDISDYNTYTYSLKIDEYFHFKTVSLVFKQKVFNENKLNDNFFNKKDFAIKFTETFEKITEKSIFLEKYYNLLIIKIYRENNE